MHVSSVRHFADVYNAHCTQSLGTFGPACSALLYSALLYSAHPPTMTNDLYAPDAPSRSTMSQSTHRSSHSNSKNLDRQREKHWATVLDSPKHLCSRHALPNCSRCYAAPTAAPRDEDVVLQQQRYPCGTAGCDQTFAHRSSRSRHKKNFHHNGV